MIKRLKNNFIVSGILLLMLISCNPENLPLPSSAGGFDQIMVVMEPELKSYLKDSIHKYLEKPYEILNQNEASLEVAISSYPKLNSLMKRYRNIIFIGIQTSNAATSKFIVEHAAAADKKIVIKNNIWAQPQLASFILADNKDELKSQISSYMNYLMDLYLSSELKEYKKLAFASGINHGLKKQLQDYYGFTIDIPQDYVLAESGDGFVWLRKDDAESTINIMLYAQDSVEKYTDGIDIRDRLGKKYVSSNVEGAYMGTDTLIPVMKDTIEINHQTGVESRGLWRMYGDFKGGPFLNTCFSDKDQWFVCLEGFIYAPGEEKKGYLRQLEAIFSTFHFIRNDPVSRNPTQSNPA